MTTPDRKKAYNPRTICWSTHPHVDPPFLCCLCWPRHMRQDNRPSDPYSLDAIAPSPILLLTSIAHLLLHPCCLGSERPSYSVCIKAQNGHPVPPSHAAGYPTPSLPPNWWITILHPTSTRLEGYPLLPTIIEKTYHPCEIYCSRTIGGLIVLPVTHPPLPICATIINRRLRQTPRH